MYFNHTKSTKRCKQAMWRPHLTRAQCNFFSLIFYKNIVFETTKFALTCNCLEVNFIFLTKTKCRSVIAWKTKELLNITFYQVKMLWIVSFLYKICENLLVLPGNSNKFFLKDWNYPDMKIEITEYS